MSSIRSCLAIVVFAILQLQCCSASTAKPKIEATALEYMSQVNAKIADTEGIPKDLDTAPTSVWCFPDKAVVNGEHRAKPTGEGGKCGAIGRFLFNWESVANTMSVTLSKSIIRSYMQVINRLIQDEEVIPVNISVSLQLFHKNMTANSSATNTSFHFVQTINVTSKSDGWLELDLTPSVLSIWSPTYKQLPIIEVTLRMEVDCLNHKKVPFQFINPAEVELFKTNRREKYTKLQSLLVVFLEDQVVKQKLKDEDKLKVEEVKEATDGLDISKTTQPGENRRRRQINTPTCGVQDFTVNFTELFLDNIILPQTLNIGRCVGDCTHFGILGHNLATNHARIISSAKHLDDVNGFRTSNSTMYYQFNKNPCCTPIRYSSVYVLIYFGTLAYKTQLFPNMKVTECSCR